MTAHFNSIAIWTLTAKGTDLGRRLQEHLPESRLFVGQRAAASAPGATPFTRLAETLPRHFHQYTGHVFIMAAGIVVRSLEGLLQHKTKDPAVVVMDECGQYAISLLSGHLGGANDLARRIGVRFGALPVITTATDLNQVPAIDLIAQERHLAIENPEAIRHVSMALLEGRSIALHDPYGYLQGALPDNVLKVGDNAATGVAKGNNFSGPGVWVDDIRIDRLAETLILRPASLFIGVGCNRHTPAAEMRALLERVLAQFSLAADCIAGLASIDIKADEEGLLELARDLSRPLSFFTRDQLATVPDIPSPSTMVEKHVGVPSVCEAAAILASGRGPLIVPKQTTPNVTIAIARKSSTSSA